MPFIETTATQKVKQLQKRIRAVAGGTSASKTISILLVLIALAQTDESPTITSVTSESLPHLKLAAMRDFLRILQDHNYFEESRWSKSDFIYTFESGSIIEFFGGESTAKVHGPRRDRLFVNEANNIPYNSFDQMLTRTNEFAFIDWNPTNEFWFYTEILPNPLLKDDIDYITLTYKDNEGLNPVVVKSIESHRNNKNWWQVYGLGQLGEAEGRIFTNWQIIDEIPHEARLERRGLDFGYSNDPTTITGIYWYNGGIILDEELYQTGMSNRAIADFIKNLPHWQTLIKADSAEPKSIDELLSYGITVLPANKGQGSVNQGIQKLQGMQVSMTKRSLNLIKEYRNYMWETDKDGKILNVPMDDFNHCLDGTRYGIEDWRDEMPVRKRFHGYQNQGRLGFGNVPVYN